MSWNVLGSLFCLELAFGTFVFLWAVSKAPLSPFFHRMNGAFAALFLLGSAWLDWGKRISLDGYVLLLSLGVAIALLAYLIACFPMPSRRRRFFLALASVSSGLALMGGVFETGGGNVLFALSAAASGLIVAGVGIAMAVGHCYLTVPTLEISYLSRLNFATVGAIVLKTFCVLAILFFVVGPSVVDGESGIFRPMGYFHLGTRVLVGLAMPLLFALMVRGCLKHQATRSATGILYASTVLVILGEAIGLSLWSTYGVPL